MDWKLLDDPMNVENGNAGNGGDLVKHTIYLATLQFLLTREPWIGGLHIRECHAGRGVFQIPRGDPRRRLLLCLFSRVGVGNPAILHGAQHEALAALRSWSEGADKTQWYAGSALINALTLDGASSGRHSLDLYEWQPETRRVLRSVIVELQSGRRLPFEVFIPPDDDATFDGEAYIKDQIHRWGKQDVVLLDPFAMWRQHGDQHKRERYGSIIDSLIRSGADAPALILFWTWGRAFPVAEGDLNGTNEPVRHGYQDLRARLHLTGLRFVLVKWRWGLQFAMWVIAPQEHVAALREEIDYHCDLLTGHLLRSGCARNLKQPRIEVTLD